MSNNKTDKFSIIAEIGQINVNKININTIDNIDTATEYIKTQDRLASTSWFNMAHALKKVRDAKIYKERFDTFDEYCECELNYKKSTVYNFLKIADSFGLDTKENILTLGVTKLIELSNVEPEIREELIEEKDIETMSIKEMKTKICSIKKFNSDNYGKKFAIVPEEKKSFKDFADELRKVLDAVDKIGNADQVEFDSENIYYILNMIQNTNKNTKILSKICKKYL